MFLPETRKNKLARGTTTDEFEMMMRALLMLCRTKLFQSYGLDALFSFDNSGPQKWAEFPKMCMYPAEKVPLAAYMPDGHKVIEHTFHRLKQDLWNSLLGPEGPIHTGVELQDRVERLFFAQPQAHFKRDGEDLPLTYHYIATDKGVHFTGPDNLEHVGTGGDWAPSAHM